jgi:hypothetical protein
MDDDYAVGPADIVFPAIVRFADAVRESLGLVLRYDKLACFSFTYDLEHCEQRIRLNIPLGTTVVAATALVPAHTAHGILVAGVPIGTAEFVAQHVQRKGEEIVSQINDTIARLHFSPHHAWAALFYCLTSRLDYLLQHLPPSVMMGAARDVDDAITRMAEACGYQGMFLDGAGDLSLRRLRLPARFRGCGLRSRQGLAPAAFAANFATAAAAFLPSGGDPGFFPMLAPLFGDNAFEADGHRFTELLRNATPASLPTAHAFGVAWESLRAEVAHSDAPGPLSCEAASAGLRCATRLQHAVTAQRELVSRDRLHRDIMALPDGDPRQEAWVSADQLSSAWVASWPSPQREWALQPREFREVFTGYLGLDSPCVRALAGQPIRGGGAGVARICDAQGRQLCLANLPGDSFRVRHNVIAEVVFRDVKSFGLVGAVEPRTLFMHVLPQDVLASAATAGIIPDARLRVDLPPVRAPGPARVAAQPAGMRAPVGEREYLFDVKTLSAGGPNYHRRYRANGGAVAERARQVPQQYETAARRLDLRHHGTIAPDTGPVLTALRGYPPVRGLVFGAYGEASQDVHALLKAAAVQGAKQRWSSMGARSCAEAEGIFSALLRRRWGIVSVREYARMRLARVCYVGSAPRIRSSQVSSVSEAWDQAPVFSLSAFQAGAWAH